MREDYAAPHAKAFHAFFETWWEKHRTEWRDVSEYSARCMAMDFWLARGEWEEEHMGM